MFTLDSKDLNTFTWPEGNILVYIGGPWCPPCRAVLPYLEKLISRYPEAPFIKFNIETKNDFVHLRNTEFEKIMSVPTMCIMNDGKILDHKRVDLELAEEFFLDTTKNKFKI
jgi:thioredoxin 1